MNGAPAPLERLDDGRRFQPLEEVEVFTPLGLRFWDPVLDRPVRHGLRVRAWPIPRGRPKADAFRTRSGVYAFERLPGLYAARADTSPRRRFVVEVVDSERRFLAAAFAVELPLPYPGVFLGRAPGGLGSPASPGAAAPGFMLFSSPVRPRAPGMAAVQGELMDAESRAPAAHAVVRVELPGGKAHWSMADRGGRFAVLFPLPTLTEELPPLHPSPPVSPPPVAPLEDRTWEITVTVAWDPSSLTPLVGTDQPEHRTVLAQPAADVLTAPPGSPPPPVEPSWAGVLGYGGDVVVKTAGSSRLWIVS